MDHSPQAIREVKPLEYLKRRCLGGDGYLKQITLREGPNTVCILKVFSEYSIEALEV